MKFLPELLKFENGESVKTASDWERRRAEIIKVLSEQVYGYMPPAPKKVTATIGENPRNCCSGHATLEKVTVSITTEIGEFSFPMNFFVPKGDKKSPLILMMNFRPDEYDRYCPVEEIIDNGFALAVFCYKDVSSDDADFTNGLSGVMPRGDEPTAWGKISLWAWAASRAIDYLFTRPEVDNENIVVAGHSRLGKTALWCAANDERVKFVCSNGSGCGGAAYERHKSPAAETVRDITNKFPYWFCDNYKNYADNPENMPFDQHFLIAAVSPRYVCVGSADRDKWADPYAEQLSCIGATPAWKLLGRDGYIGKTTAANTGDDFADGSIGYHLRDGTHFFGRGDWISFMRFIRGKMQDC